MKVMPQNKTIFDLLYTPRLASQILQDRQTGFWSISKVEIPDPNKPDVVIYYTNEGTEHTYNSNAYEFWQPFASMRLFRAQDYTAAPQDGGTWSVQSLDDPNKPPYTVNLAAEGEGRCNCLDLQNQASLLQQHLWLWEAIAHQPNCKHCYAAMGTKEPTASQTLEIVFANPNPEIPDRGESVDAMAIPAQASQF